MVAGYKYNDPVTDTECIVFHVDDHDCMQEFANEMFPPVFPPLSASALL